MTVCVPVGRGTRELWEAVPLAVIHPMVTCMGGTLEGCLDAVLSLWVREGKHQSVRA